jgi:hypothetical protein
MQHRITEALQHRWTTSGQPPATTGTGDTDIAA